MVVEEKQIIVCRPTDLHCAVDGWWYELGIQKNNWNYSSGIQFKFYRVGVE